EDRVATDEALVALEIEQLLERVHRMERLDVLLVQQQAARPDRRLRQPGCAVAGEAALEDHALAREARDRWRELDLAIVGGEIVAAHAVDHEDENVGLHTGTRHELLDEIDLDGVDVRRT